jgi:hypothetical protein
MTGQRGARATRCDAASVAAAAVVVCAEQKTRTHDARRQTHNWFPPKTDAHYEERTWIVNQHVWKIVSMLLVRLVSSELHIDYLMCMPKHVWQNYKKSSALFHGFVKTIFGRYLLCVVIE